MLCSLMILANEYIHSPLFIVCSGQSYLLNGKKVIFH